MPILIDTGRLSSSACSVCAFLVLGNDVGQISLRSTHQSHPGNEFPSGRILCIRGSSDGPPDTTCPKIDTWLEGLVGPVVSCDRRSPRFALPVQKRRAMQYGSASAIRLRKVVSNTEKGL